MWILPVGLLLLMWAVAPTVIHAKAYKLPTIGGVVRATATGVTDGVLYRATIASLGRLAIAFILGAVLGIIVGLAMATSRVVMYVAEPVVAFFQAVAGVAWIPLAIVWFGFGTGPVLFVVGNAVFFIVVYNTVLGVRQIPIVLISAARTLGASRFRLLREVIVPGALVSVLTGLRGGLAFGWRALIAVEIIAASTGLGYITVSASANYQSALIIVAIIEVGLLWLAMDRFLLRTIERRTIERWGLILKEQVR